MSNPKRSEVYLVNLGPTIEGEIRKTRPAVVIQNNILNQHSSLTIVCPLTSTLTTGPTKILIKHPEGGLKNDSVVLTQQIRCLDKKRLVKKLGKLEKQTMGKIDFALKVAQGLIPI